VSNVHHQCARFVDTITRIFHHGLHVDQDVIHYLDSTVSGHDPETLRNVLQDPSNCEHGPLIELLYFPNESIQAELEGLLEKAAFTAEDERTIGTLLTARPGETRFCFSGEAGDVTYPTPNAGALAFLSRLKIAKHLDQDLITAVDTRLPVKRRDPCKVRIRNACFEMSPRKIACLKSFFAASNPDGETFDHQFRFLLCFLEEWKSPCGLLDALAEKKRLYVGQFNQAVRMESLQQNQNIETLMMSGIRSPYLNRQDILGRIAAVDDIALAIFGQTVYVENFSMG